ncbi:MAG TPA: disulfide oxidoreductase [Acidimicrobiia bacterium]|jgi:disulfide bond formation protein DsbB|nr:disulfide oxidoreductase [Acidimicrobiia bacterium]
MSFEAMRSFFSLLAILVDLAVVAGVALLVGSRFASGIASTRRRIEASLYGRELTLAFIIAATATLGSLYLSEIAHLEPCKFCWFQRIAMYPLAVILGIAAWRKDRNIRIYATTLAVVGASIAAYHYLIQQFPTLSAGECSVTVPCTAAYIWEFGFVSIPWMALSAFALIILFMHVARSNDHNENTPLPGSEGTT